MFRVRRGARYRPRCLHDRCGSRVFFLMVTGGGARTALGVGTINAARGFFALEKFDELPPFLLAPVLYIPYGILIIYDTLCIIYYGCGYVLTRCHHSFSLQFYMFNMVY